MTGKANLAASVLARLLDRAKQTGDDYQTLLSSYYIERFLFRLGASNLRNRFLLKGAMLLRVWTDQPYRATRDLGLLRRGEGNIEAIGDDIRAIIVTSVPPDAVEFDGSRIRLEAIRAEDEYVGTRAMLPARCGTARLMIQIDMGLGDTVWPAPWLCPTKSAKSAKYRSLRHLVRHLHAHAQLPRRPESSPVGMERLESSIWLQKTTGQGRSPESFRARRRCKA